MNELNSDSISIAKAKLLGSLLLFTQYFYEILNRKEFKIAYPIGREPRQFTICRELTLVSKLQTRRLMINIPPGFGKSTHICMFIAWCLAKFPNSQFIYVSHSSDLATKHTNTIRQIIGLRQYSELFGVKLLSDSKAKDDFGTNLGGRVIAFGSKGAITGHDAGLPYSDRFTGCLIIDDIHKPDEAHSDTWREFIKRNYQETLKRRLRSPTTPIIFIGQRLHEDDLAANFINKFDGDEWKTVILKALDDDGNALGEDIISKQDLENLALYSPYTFASQYQQNPSPAGGGIFKREWLTVLDNEPIILQTFITVDTAETEKTYNDATVFSFFGLYKINQFNSNIEVYALHFLDCMEIRVEPKDLQPSFLQFYSECMGYPIKPKFVAIEKKSTGTTLISVLKDIQGIYILDIPRTVASHSKSDRFLEIQPFISKKLLTFPKYGKHNDKCIEHLIKITANNSHRHDDIADTVADAIKLALIDKNGILYVNNEERDFIADKFAQHHLKITQNSGISWQSMKNI